MSAHRRPHLLMQLLAPTGEKQPGASVLRKELAVNGTFASSVQGLAELVGGIDVLETLATDPLPAVEIDASGVDSAASARIDATIGAFASRYSFIDVPDAEYRTIIARLVNRILERAPSELLRSTPQRVGAALVWLAMHGNGDLGERRRLTASFIWDGFDVSPASDLGRRLHHAAGLAVLEDPAAAGSPVWLTDVALLHSRTRRRLVARRDGLVKAIEEMSARQRARAPVRRVAADRVVVEGHRTAPQLAVRSTDASGRHTVVMILGNDESDLQGLALSVPDAHRLSQMLQRALAANVDQVGSASTS